MDLLRKRYGREVFRAVVRENIAVAEAVPHGKPVLVYKPRSNGAEDYRAVAGEFLNRQKRRRKAS